MNGETTFDLDKYLRVSGATKPERFDWTLPQPKLDDQALFCVGYMMDIESQTIVYMQDLLSTSVVQDPQVTAFLSCWAYEEFFHSLLLRRFLNLQGVEVDDRRFAELRRRRTIGDRIVRPLAAIVSRFTRHFPAVHMTWGAINELSTLTGYSALIDRTDPYAAAADIDSEAENNEQERPLLTVLLQKIIKDERRHFAFYFNQARWRLQEPAARRLTSLLVRRFWAPVGTSVRGGPDIRRVCAFLFPGANGVERLNEIDAVVSRLPGLDWFDLVTHYCSSA